MSNLLPGENLVLKDHPHWITIVNSLIVPVVLLVVVAIADFTILFPQSNGGGIYVPHLRTFLSLGVVALVLLWLASGPLFGFSDTWQLVINTGTTIVTFLMVFLVQHTQNRDARALHLKLDELLRSKKAARNSLIDLENCTDEELDRMEQQFRALRRREEQSH